jgi:hypothetical protein
MARIKFKSLVMAIAVLGFSMGAAHASEHWEGSGTVFTPAGVPISSYDISIDTIQQGSSIAIETYFDYADGSSRFVSQSIDFAPGGRGEFTLRSDLGRGSGVCYTNGTCQMYVADGLGHAYSTYSTQHGDQLEHLTDETYNGVLVHVYRETLYRSGN